MADIFTETPVWVWALLGVLLFVGLRSLKTRETSAIPYFALPFLGILAASTVGGLQHAPLNWVCFGVGYVAGAVPAFSWQDGLILAKAGQRMTVRGEPVTLVLLLVIFGSNFVFGIAEATGSSFLQGTGFTIILAALLGAGSGSFAGRAVRVISIPQRP